MVLSISLTHLLDVRRWRKAIAIQERLKAYRELHGFCEAIAKRTELIQLESIDNLHLHLYTGGAWVGIRPSPFTRLVSDIELDKLPRVSSFEEVQNLNLAQWFRLPAYEDRFKDRSSMRANAFTPLAFYYWTEVRPAFVASVPTSETSLICQYFERRIMDKGYNLYFSSRVKRLANEIYDMASRPDKYRNITLKEFLNRVAELDGRIQAEIPR